MYRFFVKRYQHVKKDAKNADEKIKNKKTKKRRKRLLFLPTCDIISNAVVYPAAFLHKKNGIFKVLLCNKAKRTRLLCCIKFLKRFFGGKK